MVNRKVLFPPNYFIIKVDQGVDFSNTFEKNTPKNQRYPITHFWCVRSWRAIAMLILRAI